MKPSSELRDPKARLRQKNASNRQIIEEGLAAIESCTKKLVEFGAVRKRVVELTGSASATITSDVARAIQQNAEEILDSVEGPIEDIFMVDARLMQMVTNELGAFDDAMLEPSDAMDLTPAVAVDVPMHNRLPKQPREKVWESSDVWKSVHRQRMTQARNEIFARHSVEGMHNSDIRAILTRIEETASVQYHFQTGFGMETISASRALFVSVTHESFTICVELNVVGSATPRCVHVKPRSLQAKRKSTLNVNPSIGSKPTSKTLQDMEALLNEALEWYWQCVLEKYVAMDPTKQRTTIPGIEVLERVLLYGCSFRSLLLKLPHIKQGTPMSDSTASLSGYYRQSYKRTRDEMIELLKQQHQQ